MKTFMALFGLLALVNAAPQCCPYGPQNNGTGPPDFFKRPPPYPKSHENTKDKREANPEAWDLQEEDVYGEPRRIHAKHENTKDKREANPESWDLSDELVYGEPRRVHAKYDYERREKRELLRHPDLTMDVPDYFDNGDGYGAPPAASAERHQYDNRRARRDVQLKPPHAPIWAPLLVGK